MSGDYPFVDQGRRLRLLRQAEGIKSGTAFAARLGWTQAGVSLFETGMRRVPLDKAKQLGAKIPGFGPIWLWEGDKRGLSFDLRKRIEDEEAKEQAQGILPHDLRGPDKPLPSRLNGDLQPREVRIAKRERWDKCKCHVPSHRGKLECQADVTRSFSAGGPHVTRTAPREKGLAREAVLSESDALRDLMLVHGPCRCDIIG